MISVSEAYKLVMGSAQPHIKSSALEDAIGHRLAEDIVSDRPMPPFDRVTMDGIAIHYDAYASGIRSFNIENIAPAGAPTVSLQNAERAIEVMTGAVLPIGTDTVIRYEDLKADSDRFSILKEVRKGQNIHMKSSDRNRGEILLRKGTRIKAIDINVLASVGKDMVKVYDRPRVAIISSGDELVEVKDTPKEYQIRKSNVYMLQARLRQLGVPSDLYHIRDVKEVIEIKLRSVLEEYQVILLSGGVSRGKFDFIPQVLDSLGIRKLFHGVTQRPGKPFWFGVKGHKVVFAFPGNPVSTLACFHKYFVPWLEKIQGGQTTQIQVVLAEDVSFKPDLHYLAQARIAQSADTRWMAYINRSNGSGDLIGPSSADGFVELSRGKEIYEAGEIVSFIPFHPMIK